MAKDDKIEVEGKVLKSLPWAQFEVELPEEFSNMVIRAYVGGKMQKHMIRLIPGDTVVVELTPYDLTRGRIVFRKQTQKQHYKGSGGPKNPQKNRK